MSFRRRPQLGIPILLGLAGLFALPPSLAQAPWANTSYKYRRSITVQNASGASFAAGDVATYSYIPQFGPVANQMTTAGSDAKIYYFNGTTNVDVPQVILPMGIAAAKILFSLQAPLAAPTYLTENASAGNTGYATLPAGTPVTALDGQDDAATVVTLPFNFPTKSGPTNQLTIATDGFVKLGNQPYNPRPDSLANLQNNNIIAPYSSDFAVLTAEGDHVYYYADATQAVVRWEVSESAAGPIIAKFALVLTPDGNIRFVYSNLVTEPVNDVSYWPVVYGVGSSTGGGIAHQPADPADMSNHADILYTQSFTPTQSSGYFLYYGSPTDNGTAGRTLPPADKLVAYTFDDGTAQGWAIPSTQTETALVEGATVSGQKVLHMQGTRTAGHPMIFAKTQTTMLGDVLVYGKVTATGSNEVGIGARGSDAGAGYFDVLDGFGSQEGIVQRTTPGESHDYNLIGNTIPFTVKTWSYDIERVTGTTASGIFIQGRGFVDGSSDPGSWQVSAGPNNDVAKFDTGTLCMTGWEGGASDQYADWIYATNANAELPTYNVGSEEVTPPPAGKGSLVVTVTDATTTAPIANATVTVTPTGGGTPVVALTDNRGELTLALDPGTYTVQVASNNYTGQTVTSGAVTVGGSTSVSVALVAPELITNGGFETADPAAPTVKPLGWYRRDYAANGTPDPNAATPPWIYDRTSADAHTGTASVAFSGSVGIAAWEQEGSVVGSINADNRGKGPLIPIKSGEVYKVTAWFRKPASTTGKMTLRIRFTSTDDPNTLIAGGSTDDVVQSATWKQVTRIITAPSDGYMQVRIYGSDILSTETGYADDVSAVRIATPVFRGVVHDSSGNPVSNVGVGIHEATGAGLADPIAATTTDGVGRFALSFLPAAGTSYVVQAWKDGNAVSANFPLGTATSLTDVTYNPTPVADFALRKPVVFTTGDDGSQPPSNAVDGNEGTRWASSDQNPTDPALASKNPAAMIIDLGQPVDFSKVKQISIIWEAAVADHYQIRVSNTAPAFTALGDLATYGTLLYDSPTNAGDRTYVRPGGDMADVISGASLGTTTGRYVEVYMDKFYQLLGNYSIYELKIELTQGIVTGKVVDTTGKPVAGAAVGAGPDAASYATTDANGNYSLSMPTGLGSFSLVAHKVDSGDTVYPVSAPVTVTPTVGGVTAPTLVLGPAVPNVVPTTSTADTDPTGIYDATNPPALAVDHKLDTRWVTFPIPSSSPISPTNQIGFYVDMGSAKTFNEIVINWETANAGAYAVYVGNVNDVTQMTKVYDAPSASGGYSYTFAGGGHKADAISLPNPVTAQFIRLQFYMPGPVSDRVSIWELQAGNVASAPLNGQDVLNVLRIAGGLQAATAADRTRLDTNGDNRIDILDAVKLLRQVNGL